MSFRLSGALLTAACAAIAWCGVLAAAPMAAADAPTIVAVLFGQTGDVPITGDWDGSGVTELARVAQGAVSESAAPSSAPSARSTEQAMQVNVGVSRSV